MDNPCEVYTNYFALIENNNNDPKQTTTSEKKLINNNNNNTSKMSDKTTTTRTTTSTKQQINVKRNNYNNLRRHNNNKKIPSAFHLVKQKSTKTMNFMFDPILWQDIVCLIAILEIARFLSFSSLDELSSSLEDNATTTTTNDNNNNTNNDNLFTTTIRNNHRIDTIFSITWILFALSRGIVAGHRAIMREEELELKKPIAGVSVRQKRLWFAKWLTLTFVVYFSLLPLSFLRLSPSVSYFTADGNDEDGTKGQQQQPHEVEMDVNRRYSLFYYLLLQLLSLLSSRVTYAVRTTTHHILKKAATQFIRNPLHFKKTIHTLLIYLRWIKYLAPLIGTANKLKGNVADLTKKTRQYLEARRVRLLRRRKFRRMTPEERTTYAVVKIQTTFRARRDRKYSKALEFLRMEKRRLLVMKIQASFRRLLARARVTLEKKRRELVILETRYRRSNYSLFNHASDDDDESNGLSTEEKRRLFRLRHELRERDDRIRDAKLLFRPNTSFAVMWRSVYVICVILEIIDKALSPSSSLKQQTEDWMLPPPKCVEMAKTTLRLEDGRAVESKNGRGMKALLRKVGGGIKSLFKKKHDKTCPILTSFDVERYDMTKNLITFFFAAMEYIFFFDVFVAFFTGEIHPVSGALVPKAFFTRWIIPGVCLQLIVNPTMKSIAAGVKGAWRVIHAIGPMRVLRLWIAIKPVRESVRARWREHWEEFVGSENQKSCDVRSLFPSGGVGQPSSKDRIELIESKQSRKSRMYSKRRFSIF